MSPNLATPALPSEPDSNSGLSAQAAAALLASDGYNELPSAKPRRIWHIALDVIKEPMLLLLIACGAIYLLLGDTHEALVLLVFVFVIISISFFQEHKSERALEALRELSSPRALVLRDGVQQRVAGREVVRGDLILLSEGDRVPADAILLSCLNMTVDESLLTGESMPVNKALLEPAPSKMEVAGGDDLPFIFSGSLVVQGKGMARVIATGSDSAIGRIGKALFALEQEPTRVQLETTRVVKYVASLSIGIALLLALWYGYSRGDWLAGILVGITFAMALIPEELPVVLTLFLGLGAWRLSQKNVLTRRVPAIETLGAATVLCVDKTGTLTQNKMAVAQVFCGDQYHHLGHADQQLPEDFHEVLEYAILASHRDPYDPMEVAILEAGIATLKDTEHLHQSWNLVNEYPLSKELLAMSRVWESKDNQHYVIATKGAPEAIADLCHLTAIQCAKLMAEVNTLAAQGLRVLGVAKAIFKPRDLLGDLPPIQHDYDFELVGLIGLADPIRPAVPAAIRECQSAGIRVIMITGDYPATASSIAKLCGLLSAGGIMTGTEMSALSDVQLQQKIQNINIFCRVQPEQKLRLVNLLKSNQEIVAMTGDGVNDAPALKAAHIGVAMGKRGSDVARESAALVLLDDDFSSIVAAVKLGRRIFDNLRKTVSFIVAVHIPVIGMSLIPVMLDWPIFLMPVHILVLQLIIDPTCSLVFEAEAEEDDLMQRGPRATDASIFDRTILLKGALQGLALLAAVFATYATCLHLKLGEQQARALGFCVMVLGNIGLIFINRSLSASLRKAFSLPNPALWWVVGAALSILSAALFVPALSSLFYFTQPSMLQLAISIAIAGACIASIALVKFLVSSMRTA
ncbi:cation-translocating P-type ATPase [Undibacterium parvum]|uniref:Cation-translocating P-type ATPase n=1 Tax=Undibacterium parvum TaxID=401471 RepID=A0A3Q9BRW7_9BURK|nr:cation-translocating P-type ATPase [Undibacterium parvum]AZP12604.1 cation-translocating P-type ATPase [Undibacterium parvum]